jgi:hypothetical protein
MSFDVTRIIAGRGRAAEEERQRKNGNQRQTRDARGMNATRKLSRQAATVQTRFENIVQWVVVLGDEWVR